MVDESRVLMGKAVMGLLPDVGGEQIIERGDFSPPRQLGCDLQPFGVLVEHGIDDVNKGLVAVDPTVPTGEEVTFALMLGEHLHDLAVGCQKLIGFFYPGFPLAVGHLKNGVQPVERVSSGPKTVKWSYMAAGHI